MRSLLLSLALVASLSAQAARIPRDAVLYIEPTDFGQALAAAILKKQVPIRLTTDRAQASYVLASTSEVSKEGQGERVAKILVSGGLVGSGNSFQASVTITDLQSAVLFAYSSKKSNFQSAAEGVAKNLKKHIEGK